MKTNYSRDANGGLTVIEMLVVLTVVVILIAMVLPARHRSGPSFQSTCMNHLRQIGIGFLVYAQDNHDTFPIGISITNGGTMEYLDRNQTFPHYQKLSTNIDVIRFLVCPVDKTRKPAENYGSLTDANISYFLSADVSMNHPAQSILSGDRHLRLNSQAVRHGTLVFTKNMDLGWTPELHQGNGMIAFADGHAQFCRSPEVNSIIQRQGLATNRFSVP